MKKIVLLFGCVLALMLIMTGCRYDKKKERENDLIRSLQTEFDIEIQIPDAMPVSICVDYGEAIDGDALLEYFFEGTSEELVKEGALWQDYGIDLGFNTYMGYVCNKEEKELIYHAPYIDRSGNFRSSFFEFIDTTDGGVGYIYYKMLGAHFEELISNRIMNMYPEEELEACSRKEVLKICEPLVAASGYQDAEVSIYAMTEENLKREAVDDVSGMVSTAPGPDCEKNPVKWSKEHEAYLVVYQVRLDDLLFVSKDYCLMCIYVPKYQRIVYANARQSLVEVEKLEETIAVIQTDSFLESIRTYLEENTSSDKIAKVSMVYFRERKKILPEVKRKVIDPCWRVDYEVSEEKNKNPGYGSDDWTVIINAMDGRILD